MRDLRRFWREGGEDPGRTIAHVFASVGVFQNLIPLLLATAGGGERSQKIALACTDLLTSITWPVDAAAEMRVAKERGEPPEELGHLLQLENGMVAYKLATLRGVGDQSSQPQQSLLGAIMRHILIPALDKDRHQRSERDVGTISMALHFFRNLLAIKDPLATTLSSNTLISESTLQSDLVCEMQRTHILETLLIMANNADKQAFAQWNVITAECVYAVYGGQKGVDVASFGSSTQTNSSPIESADKLEGSSSSQAGPSTSQQRAGKSAASSSLASFLNAEAHEKRVALATTGSRHSRFGTTINFKSADGDRRVARNASSLRKTVEELRLENELRSRRKGGSRKRVAIEHGAPVLQAEWTPAARQVLRDWADRFLLSRGFETLLASVLKDVRAEREKVGDLDKARVRVMLLASFFLDYMRERRRSTLASTETSSPESASPWRYELVEEWLGEWAFKMVLVRSMASLEYKAWLELEAALRLWLTLLRVVDDMAQTGTANEQDRAERLQANHFYHKETLDFCSHIARCCNKVKQSFAFTGTVLAFLHWMPRMLERYSTNKEHLFVRAKRHAHKARAKRMAEGVSEESGDADAQDARYGGTEEEETRARAQDLYTDRRLDFDRFQTSICARPLVQACIAYLSRWRDFTRPQDQLSDVVAVMHRIAVKAGDVRSFYPAEIRASLRNVLAGPLFAAMEPVAPRAAGDCKKLIQYCIRRYEKLDESEKQLWGVGQAPPRKAPKPAKMEREIQVKAGMTREEQVGVAVGLLAERNQLSRVTWLRQALSEAASDRLMNTFAVDGLNLWRRMRESKGEEADMDVGPSAVERDVIRETLEDSVPSPEAVKRFQAHDMDDGGQSELINDLTRSPTMKLLCRLIGLESDEDDEQRWRWRIPANILPAHLEADADLIDQWISQPLSLGEAPNYEALTQPARKKRQPTVKSALSPAADSDGDSSSSSSSDADSDSAMSSDDDAAPKKKKAGHRRRKDLKGDPRKKKNKSFQRKQASQTGPLFLADDIIDSDEEDEVERMWRAKHGMSGTAAPEGSVQDTPPRPKPRRFDSENRSPSPVDSLDGSSNRSIESRSPSNSPSLMEILGRGRPIDYDSESDRGSYRSSLSSSSDSEESRDAGQEEEERSTPGSSAVMAPTSAPQKRRRGAIVDSDGDDDHDGAGRDGGDDYGEGQHRQGRSPLAESTNDTRAAVAKRPRGAEEQTPKPRGRASLAAAISALADSDEE